MVGCYAFPVVDVTFLLTDGLTHVFAVPRYISVAFLADAHKPIVPVLTFLGLAVAVVMPVEALVLCRALIIVPAPAPMSNIQPAVRPLPRCAVTGISAPTSDAVPFAITSYASPPATPRHADAVSTLGELPTGHRAVLLRASPHKPALSHGAAQWNVARRQTLPEQLAPHALILATLRDRC